MAKRGKTDNSSGSSANLGFEAKLWLAADKLRNNMDAAEYKHVVLGLIFLKYISDSFEEHHARLVEGKGDLEGAAPKSAMNTSPTTCSGFPKRPGNRTCRPMPSSPPSASFGMMPRSPSRATMRGSKASCPRTTPNPPSSGMLHRSRIYESVAHLALTEPTNVQI